MAASVRTRNSYSPVSVDDTGQDRLVRHESQTSLTKPKRRLSVWTFSLLIICVCVLFLLGFCLGFYVRESQSPVSDILAECGGKADKDDPRRSKTAIHEDIMYRIRGEEVAQFMREFSYEDPVSESLVERKLEQRVRQALEESMLDDFEVEEHEVVVTYADPTRPNHLQVLRNVDNTVVANITLKNDDPVNGSADSAGKLSSHTTTDDWKFPFVVFSPPGTAEGSLVYSHYGTEADLLVLQAKRVSLKDRVVLLRLGKLSLAEKVRNVADLGAAGVLVYWDPVDAEDSVDIPSNTSYIPYASAAVYSSDSSHVLVPSIPVQTVSADIAATLMDYLTQEDGVVTAPSGWTGGLNTQYSLGRRNNNGNYTVRLSTYNKQKGRTVRNIISTIHGTVEKDRYVIIGAPRASLPGVPQDSVLSTALLLQLARTLTKAHELKARWKPRRGLRLVSWGGADIGNIGMLEHIKSHHHLLHGRAVAYFDVNRLMVGRDMITARVSPGFYQVLNEVSMGVPDPKDHSLSVQSAWQIELEQGLVSQETPAMPLTSYHSDRSTTPFLHVLGVPSVSLQYQDRKKSTNADSPDKADTADQKYALRTSDNVPSVAALSAMDGQHHYKFHIAVIRIMAQALLSMADDMIIPFSVTGAAEEVTAILWQTSELLDQCSHSMQDLGVALSLSKELEQTAKVFEEFISVYKENGDVLGLRTVNDIKMLFERLFIIHRKGIPHHILYPTESDNSMSIVKEMCAAGDLLEVWDRTQDIADSLKTILKEAIAALGASN